MTRTSDWEKRFVIREREVRKGREKIKMSVEMSIVNEDRMLVKEIKGSELNKQDNSFDDNHKRQMTIETLKYCSPRQKQHDKNKTRSLEQRVRQPLF
jgi:uncharacterized lipoprotein